MFKLDTKSLLTIALVALLIFYICGGMSSPIKSYMGCGKGYNGKKSYMMHGNGHNGKKSYMMNGSDSTPPPSVSGTDMSDMDDQYAPVDLSGTGIDLNVGCAMNAGVGLASSLLPREMASQEDFGQFAPDDILKGQNFLDPRNQIGFPETIGGNLRNANQQIRAEPPNPKQPYVWNNSTIVPDLMQRKICT